MRRFALLLLAISVATPLSAGEVNASVTLTTLRTGQFFSRGYVTYTNILGLEVKKVVHISHFIESTSAVFDADFETPYSKSLTSAEVGTPPNCYRGRIFGTADDSAKQAATNQICYSGPPAPGDGGDGGSTCSNAELCGPDDQNSQTPCEYTASGCDWWYGCPLIINPGHAAWTLTDPQHGVSFDLDADGRSERLSWTAPDSPLALLALDLNGNGVIDNGAELFGIGTQVPSGARAANGFDALSQYDLNSDGIIDPADPVWRRLLLWTDRNHDGRSTATELTLISASNLRSIALSSTWTGRRDAAGNFFRYRSTVDLDDGQQPFYDIYLRASR